MSVFQARPNCRHQWLQKFWFLKFAEEAQRWSSQELIWMLQVLMLKWNKVNMVIQYSILFKVYLNHCPLHVIGWIWGRGLNGVYTNCPAICTYGLNYEILSWRGRIYVVQKSLILQDFSMKHDQNLISCKTWHVFPTNFILYKNHAMGRILSEDIFGSVQQEMTQWGSLKTISTCSILTFNFNGIFHRNYSEWNVIKRHFHLAQRNYVNQTCRHKLSIILHVWWFRSRMLDFNSKVKLLTVDEDFVKNRLH
jgi:hypothetical protein